MLDQRNRGTLWTLQGMLMAADALLFVIYLLAERTLDLVGMAEDNRVYAYLIAIPVSILYSRHVLDDAIQRVRAPSLWHSLLGALRILLLQAVAVFGLYFFLKDTALSRSFILGYLLFALVLNSVLIYVLPTLVVQTLFRESKRLNAVLFGYGPLPEQLREYVEKAKSHGIRFIGYYADDQLSLPGVEWLGGPHDVMTAEGRRKRIRADLAYGYAPPGHAEELQESIDACTRRGARVHVYSDLSRSFLEPVRVITDGHLLFFAFLDEPLKNPVNKLIKRLFDIAVALPVVLFILPPLTLIVWIGQRIASPGPIFFKQTRYGMDRKPFTILKYRSMHVHDRKQEGRQATRHDPRIFAFGAFLRKTSLDEFPQFINALLGQMSIVGPRPHFTEHDNKFERYFRRYRSRHYVKPGITGLAQISGYRGETNTEDAIIGRVQHDLKYITGWSPGLDTYIFLKTIAQVLSPPKSAV